MSSSGRRKQQGPSRHVYKSGAAGCGGKVSAVAPKNTGQVIQCGYCDRTFKQDGRYKEHLKNKHGNVNSEQAQLVNPPVKPSNFDFVGDGGVISTQGPSQSSYPVKTPKTLLHEWCQKNKKPAPRYKHVEVEGGFHCRVVLPDPKRSEADVILWYDKKATQTLQEAQHFAAVMALFHVMGDRRLDRILPYEYRQQWHELLSTAEDRKSSIKAKSLKPVSRRLPMQELQSVFMSENNRHLVEGLLRNDQSDIVGKNVTVGLTSATSIPLHDMERYNEAVEIDESERLYDKEAEVNNKNVSDINSSNYEAMLGKCHSDDKRYGRGLVKYRTESPEGILARSSKMHIEDQIRSELMSMGFKNHYVSAALAESNELSGALDWLMLHVPENQLPIKFAPKSSKASVQVLVNGNEETVKHFTVGNQSVKNMQEYGYSYDDSMLALSEADGNEDLALQRLFMQTMEGMIPESTLNDLGKGRDDLHELRSEELVALQSIFGEEAIYLSLSFFKFNVKFSQAAFMPLEMEVRVLPGMCYPFEIPVVSFRSTDLSPEFLLELTRKVSERAVELVGLQMIYELFCVAMDLTESLYSKYSLEVQKSEANHTEKVASTSDMVVSFEVFSDSQRMDGFMSLKNPHISVTTAAHGPPALMCKHSDGESSEHSEIAKLPESTHGAQEDYSCESWQMKEDWDSLQSSPEYSEMHAARQKLPAFRKRQHIVNAVKNSLVTVICGQTGCGKSTQVPQYILEDSINKGQGSLCNIICTQPRRVSAIGLADRVARERGEMVGMTVGYSVRLESCQSSCTKVLFCTTGILLRRLLSDADLHDVTHVIVDEVHERTLEGDLLLLLLQEHLTRARSKLHVILMSATVKAELFASYFRERIEKDTAIVKIPGFTFPVRELYLEDALELTGYKAGRNLPYSNKNQDTDVIHGEMVIISKETDSWENWMEDGNRDNLPSTSRYSQTTLRILRSLDQSIVNYDLIEAIICFIIQQNSQELNKFGHVSDLGFTKENALISSAAHSETMGSVLVFLPGIAEIHRLQGHLRSSSRLHGMGIWILALHGSMSSEEQRRVFLKPPQGLRKVVLTTNVAETSITIEDVVYVIDTGRHKEMRYDHSKGLSCLQETWISKASAKQRRGRAGRVQPGYCFQLYSRQQFQQFEEQQLPEVLRVSLDRLCLKVKAFLGGPLQEMTYRMLTPPSPEMIRASVRSLHCMNALDEEECLTPLGQYLVQMPVDAAVGKMLIFACMLKCLNPILTIAAALSGRSPFLSPLDKREEANAARLNFSGNTKSDHMAIVAAYEGWDVARRDGRNSELEYCNANFLSRETLLGMEASRLDYLKILADIGFCPWPGKRDSNRHLNDLSINSCNVRVVKSVICAGFYPNIVQVRHPEKRYVQTESGTLSKVALANKLCFFTKLDGKVFLHPSSVNFAVGFFESPWLVFTEKVKTSKIFIKNSTMVPAYALLLFGGKIQINHEKQTIKVDDWLEFEAPARISVLIKELRSKVDSLLTEKIQNPTLDISRSMVVTTLIQLLLTDGF